MAFDLSSARPVESSKFDLSTAAPVAAAEVPAQRRTWSGVASEALTSAGPSAKRLIGGLVETIKHPVEAVSALGDVLAGGLRAAVPRQVAEFIDRIDNPETTKRIETAAQAAGGALKERYGGIEELKNTLATDPVGAVADISLLLTGVGGVTRTAGTAAKVAGASRAGAGAEAVGRAVETAANVINPLTPVVKGAELAIQQGAKGVGNLAGFVRGERPAEQAAEIARQAATGRGAPDASRLAAVRAELAQAPSGAPGAQAAAGVYAPELQALGQAIGERQPGFYGAIGQAEEVARQARLQGVTPDIAAAEAARKAATTPLYAAAQQATITLDQPMMDLFARMPKGTLEKAAEIARMDGRPFQMGQYVPAHTAPSGVMNAAGQPIMRQVPAQYPQMTGESLHYIKRALSDIAYASPATGITRDMQSAARGVLTDFLPQVESRIPAYGQARKTYAQMSEPVNQAQVLNELASILQKPGGGERLTPFMNVLGRGEEAMLKRSTGVPRYTDISQVLTTPQLGAVRDVEAQLARQANMARQVQEGTTAANLIIQANSSNVRLPSFMNVKTHIANETLRLLQDRLNAKALTKLEEGFKSAKSLDDLLKHVPASQRSEVLRTLGQVQDSLSPAKLNIWSQTGNMLAPEQTENALAR